MVAVEISSIEDLDDIRLDLEGDYELVNDLDFDNDDSYDNPSNKSTYTTGSGWDPIGSTSSAFVGVLDGKNFTIKNLFINRSTTSDVGLFSRIGGASSTVNETGIVQNLNFLNANIDGSSQTGVLAGTIRCRGINLTYVRNVNISGNIYVQGNSNLGAFCGLTEGEINNCSVDGNDNTQSYIKMKSTTTAGDFGGFIGRVQNGTVTNCFIKNILVEVQSTSRTSSLYYGCFVGTITGFTYFGLRPAEIYSCYAKGCVLKDNITSSNSYTTGGGFIGYNISFIKNCYFEGDINIHSNNEQMGDFLCTNGSSSNTLNSYSIVNDVNSTSKISNFIRTNTSGGVVTNCYTDTTVKGYSTGESSYAKTTTQMKTESTFNNWKIEDYNDYKKTYSTIIGNDSGDTSNFQPYNATSHFSLYYLNPTNDGVIDRIKIKLYAGSKTSYVRAFICYAEQYITTSIDKYLRVLAQSEKKTITDTTAYEEEFIFDNGVVLSSDIQYFIGFYINTPTGSLTAHWMSIRGFSDNKIRIAMDTPSFTIDEIPVIFTTTATTSTTANSYLMYGEGYEPWFIDGNNDYPRLWFEYEAPEDTDKMFLVMM